MNEEQPIKRVNSNNAAVEALTGTGCAESQAHMTVALTKEEREARERENEAQVAQWLLSQIRGVSIGQPRNIVDKWAEDNHVVVVFEDAAYFIGIHTTDLTQPSWIARAKMVAEQNLHKLTEFSWTSSERIGYVAMCERCEELVNVPKKGMPNGYVILQRTCSMAPEVDDN